MFKKYPKIYRLGKEENDNILDGVVHIQEKLDGANVSVWLEDGEIKCGSRTRELTEGFNGFVDYIKAHEGVRKLLEDFPAARLYGEWLVRHTISYNETAYKKFYLFDIFRRDSEAEYEERFGIDYVYEQAAKYGIDTPQYFGLFDHPTFEQINEFVGQTNLGEKGEGIVIKRDGFVNKFGDPAYAKVVTEDFKEANALTFGGNNKHSEAYWEMYIVQKYMTLPRIEKIMNKLQPLIEKRLDMEHTARVISTAYHDMIVEEIWDIQKKVPKLDFKRLKNLSCRKAAKIYHDILRDHISVAYETTNT